MKISLANIRVGCSFLFKRLSLSCLLIVAMISDVYAQQPVFDWAGRLGAVSSSEVADLVCDQYGNVYTFGAFGGTGDFDPDPVDSFMLQSIGGAGAFFSKLDADGHFLWAKKFGSAGGDVYPGAMARDSAGNLYITGRFVHTVDFDPGPAVYNLSSPNNSNIFICKYDSLANLVWARNFGVSGFDEGTAIAVDRSGNVYTTGRFSGTTDFDPSPTVTHSLTALAFDVFISKLNANGDYVWAKNIGYTYDDIGYSIALDDSANVYTSGVFAGTVDFDPLVGSNYLMTSYGNTRDAFVSKLDSSGNFVWAKQFSASDEETGASIVTDHHGNVVVGGWFNNPMDADPGTAVSTLMPSYKGCFDYFLIKLSGAGNFVWGKRSGHPPGTCNRNISIAADTAGNIYATGSFGDSSDFDPGPAVYLLNTKGNAVLPLSDQDIFVTRINANGSFSWAKSIGSLSEIDNSYGIAIDPFNNILTAGVVADSADMDPGTAISLMVLPDVLPGTDYAVYVHKMNTCSATSSSITTTACKKYILNGQTYTTSGTYTQTKINAAGCDSIITLHLTINNVVTTVSQNGNMLTANAAGATYQWLDCGNGKQPINGETGQSFSPTANGSYAVVVTQNGCSDTSVCIAVNFTGIITPGSHAFISVYPNPAHETINLGYTNDLQVQDIRLTDIVGKVVMTFKAGSKSLNISGLPAGVYFLKVQTTSGVATGKILHR